MMMEMKQTLDSMERAIILQSQARAEKRAEQAEQKEKEFQEKLMRAATSKAELDGMASEVKGKEDAVRRDQLMCMMLAGL